MSKRFGRVLSVGALAVTVAGCSTVFPTAQPTSSVANASGVGSHRDFGLGGVVYEASDTLAGRSAAALRSDSPILITTIVNVDDLSSSSTFGRLVSQQVLSRFAQQGHLVRDVTYMRALTMEPTTGELVLSRDAREVSASTDAQAVVVGTFATGGMNIYVTMRLLNAVDGSVLSAVDFVQPLDADMRRLVIARQ